MNRLPAPGEGPGRPDVPFERLPMPGRQAVLIAALVIGLLMLGMQLWLLTVALEMFLRGDGEDIWGLAVASGVVFLGGLFTVRLLNRRPRLER